MSADVEVMESREKVWDWLKEYGSQHSPTAFSAQLIDGSVEPNTVDELWRLVSAGILRPDTGSAQFILTEVGAAVIQSDDSPYSGTEFFESVRSMSPDLSDTAEGFLMMALRCVPAVPEAAVALLRAALETEVDSFIDVYEGAVAGSRVKNFHRRELSRRIEEVISRARGKRLLATQDDARMLTAHCDLIRISGNKVLHSTREGPPTIDPLMVKSLFHSFRSLAAEMSRMKALLESGRAE